MKYTIAKNKNTYYKCVLLPQKCDYYFRKNTKMTKF